MATKTALGDSTAQVRNEIPDVSGFLTSESDPVFAAWDKDYADLINTPSNDFYLGQDTLGGIVFYIYLDQNGDQHGLIVSKTETTDQWQSTTRTTNADRTEDGEYNTGLMTNSPAKTWVTGLGADWYLPSIDELSLLWHNRFHVNKTARAIGSTLLSTSAYYWSSTEDSATYAFGFYFDGGYVYGSGKANAYSVRAVRAF